MRKKKHVNIPIFTKILWFSIQQDSSIFFFWKKKSSTVQDRFYAPDRKFWWEHLLHIFACMHTYYNLCVRDIPLLEQKNHTIFMYQKKKTRSSQSVKGMVPSLITQSCNVWILVVPTDYGSPAHCLCRFLDGRKQGRF